MSKSLIVALTASVSLAAVLVFARPATRPNDPDAAHHSSAPRLDDSPRPTAPAILDAGTTAGNQPVASDAQAPTTASARDVSWPDAEALSARERTFLRHADAVAGRVPRDRFVAALRSAAVRVTFPPPGRTATNTEFEGAHMALTRAAGAAERERGELPNPKPKDPNGNSPEAITYRRAETCRPVFLAFVDHFPELLSAGQATAEILVHPVPTPPRALGDWGAHLDQGSVAFVMTYLPYELRIRVRPGTLDGNLRNMIETVVEALTPR